LRREILAKMGVSRGSTTLEISMVNRFLLGMLLEI
jgi:hypothetical protein